MHAIVYAAAGDIDVIQLRDVPPPVAGPRQIRVRVHAAGLNRADILQRKGRYPAPPGWPADIPGLEYAGAVESLGPGTTRWQLGDHVMGLVGGGAHAEFVVVHEDEAIAVPVGMSLTAAAAIPEAFLTAWDALVTRGRLQPGERVLIHAVGSGVGTAAVQLAKRLGAITAGTSRNPDKLARARALGLDESFGTGDFVSGGPTVAGDPLGRPYAVGDVIIDVPGGPIVSGGPTVSGDPLGRPYAVGDVIIDVSGDPMGRPYPTVDVIIDVLGGPALAANLAALAPRGRLVMLGFLQGPSAALSLEPILRKRLEVIGSVMRTRLLEERIPLVREFSERVLPMFAPFPLEGRPQGSPVPPIRPIVGATFPMQEIAAAHLAMERDENFGKLVLSWG